MIVEWASIYIIYIMMPVSDYLRKPGRDSDMWCQYQTIWWTQNLFLHPGTLIRPTSWCQPRSLQTFKQFWAMFYIIVTHESVQSTRVLQTAHITLGWLRTAGASLPVETRNCGAHRIKLKSPERKSSLEISHVESAAAWNRNPRRAENFHSVLASLMT